LRAIWELKELPTFGRTAEYRPADAGKKRRLTGRKAPVEALTPAPPPEEATESRLPEPQPEEPPTQQPPPLQPAFDLGDELRQELDDARFTLPSTESDKGISLLHSMSEELNNPEQQGGILLLVLRFAAEYLNRSVVFMIHDMAISGFGQFGIDADTRSGDEKIRAISFSLESGSMFRTPCRTAKADTFKPELTPVNRHIFEQLGGGIPEEVFIGPIVSRSRVIGFLYGDNLPDAKRIGRTEPLEIFLAQAGAALEKLLLEQRLRERGNGAGSGCPAADDEVTP